MQLRQQPASACRQAGAWPFRYDLELVAEHGYLGQYPFFFNIHTQLGLSLLPCVIPTQALVEDQITLSDLLHMLHELLLSC
jgi:hypothetical protein